MDTLSILSDRIRQVYGSEAAFICVSTLSGGYGISALDSNYEVLALPDHVPFGDIDHLINLCSYEFSPGITALHSEVQAGADDLSTLFLGEMAS